MWKAIDHLKSQGIISRSKKTVGTRAKPVSPKTVADAAHGEQPADSYADIEGTELLWQKMLVRLKQDVLTGRFQLGQPLPSCKELQLLYSW